MIQAPSRLPGCSGGAEARPASAPRGFSFFEIILCVVVLSIAILPIFQLLVSESRQTGFVSDRAVAVALGRSVLERYRVESLSWLKTNLGSVAAGAALIRDDALLTPRPGDDVPAEFLQTLRQFERQAEFLPDPADPRKGVLRSVVTWRTRQGEARQLEVSLVLTDAELPGGRE